MTTCTTCNQTTPNKSCMDCYDEAPMYPPGRPNTMTRQQRLANHQAPWHIWHTCDRCGQSVNDCEGHEPRDVLARFLWELALVAVLLLAIWLVCHALGLVQWLCGVAD